LCAADWRLWLRHRQQAERAVTSGRRGAAQPAQFASGRIRRKASLAEDKKNGARQQFEV
jgi:hypothetical protein